MIALLARAFGSQTLKSIIGSYGKAAWTVGKRIGARNLRRWTLLDDAAPGAFGARAGETVDTTSWIMQRIIASDVSKRIKTQAVRKTGLNRTWYESSLGTTIRKGKVASHSAKINRIQSVRATQEARSAYNINPRTGEIGGGTYRDELGDIWRTLQASWLAPQTKQEQLVGGFTRGFLQQEAATLLFTMITENEDIAPFAWASRFTHNLDEIYLPPGTAKSSFAFSELLIQAFNVATVKDTGAFGLRRVNRMDIARDIAYAARNKSARLLSHYATPVGLSRVAGALTARQINIMTGEDDRQRQAYVNRAIKRQGSSGKMITIEIRPYTRSDGTRVKGHTRRVEAYY